MGKPFFNKSSNNAKSSSPRAITESVNDTVTDSVIVQNLSAGTSAQNVRVEDSFVINSDYESGASSSTTFRNIGINQSSISNSVGGIFFRF